VALAAQQLLGLRAAVIRVSYPQVGVSAARMGPRVESLFSHLESEPRLAEIRKTCRARHQARRKPQPAPHHPFRLRPCRPTRQRRADRALPTQKHRMSADLSAIGRRVVLGGRCYPARPRDAVALEELGDIGTVQRIGLAQNLLDGPVPPSNFQ
jgi:hypothetical protein